jgi:hypothetical protein
VTTATGRRPRGSRLATGERLTRLNIEIYPEHEELVRRVKSIAALRNITFQSAVMEALDRWVTSGGLSR